MPDLEGGKRDGDGDGDGRDICTDYRSIPKMNTFHFLFGCGLIQRNCYVICLWFLVSLFSFTLVVLFLS